MIRKTFFWLHLGSGVITGVVIALMSFTGVLLTYQPQILAWADSSFYVAVEENAAKKPLADIIAAAENDGYTATEARISAHPEAPVLLSAGRGRGALFMDPYSAEILGPPSPKIRRVFSVITGWHRWFGADRDNRALPRLITGVSNLVFLFLILSGLYLWLPKIIRWPLLRARLFFSKEKKNGKDRDYNWHHVFGVWSAIPLIVVVATALVFSFSWANTLVYKIAGDELPVQGRPSAETSMEDAGSPPATDRASAMSLDELIRVAENTTPAWKSISIALPEDGATSVEIKVDRGNGRQPQLLEKFIVSAYSGAIVGSESLADRSPARQARSWIRFLHTGEALGILGQSVAGIVSLTSLFMVWTGFALAYRRLIRPLIRRSTTTPIRST